MKRIGERIDIKKLVAVLLLIIVGVLSATVLANKMSDAATYNKTIESLDKKKDTVLALTTTSTAASAAITLIPGDVATPIAEKLADLSSYFLIVLCAIFAEKYLLTIVAAVGLRILVPIACAGLIVFLFYKNDTVKRFSLKIGLLGICIAFIIPLSIKVADMIEATYNESMEATIEAAEGTTSMIENSMSDEDQNQDDQTFWQKLSNVTSGLVNTLEDLTVKVKDVLSRFIEAVAIMLITSCVIPVLVIVFFVWIVKLILDINVGITVFSRNSRTGRGPRFPGRGPDDRDEIMTVAGME